jgi:DNA-binding FrmR family transcriptional regulator
MALCGDDHKSMIDRINRIEGQVRGIKKMVSEERDCIDVLSQIAATVGALRSAGMILLEDHLKGCVTEAIRNQDQGDDDQLIRQVVDIFNKFTK